MNKFLFAATGAALLATATVSPAQADEMKDGKMTKPMMSPADTMMMDKAMVGLSKDDKEMLTQAGMMAAGERRIKMMTAPTAATAGLQNATGWADVDVARGKVELVVMLPEGAQLPANTALEGWLSTAGRKGGPGPSTASERDQKFGPAFGMADLASQSRDIPYALSTGLLRRVGNSRTYVGRFHIDNPLTPYAAIAVTLETDGNMGAYDPRPGSPLMDGMIAMGMMMGKDGKMMSGMMGARLMMMSPDGAMVPAMMKDGTMTPGAATGDTLMMVMPDGARSAVTMQDGKLMTTMPDGTMSEIKMMGAM
jgi:hypothetical protein